MKTRILTLMSLALLLAVQTSCRENEFGGVDLTMPEDVYQPVENRYTYNHPSTLYTQADFDRVKTMLDNGTAPQAVKEEFENLKKSNFTTLPYTPQPQEQIVRGDATGTIAGTENYRYAMNDAAAAYQMGLIWKVTGDNKYADNAIQVLNAWVAKCKEITSNDANQMLAAGAQGYTFALAGEMLRTYEGWKEKDFAAFKEWMVKVFASKNRNFMDTHQGSNNCAEHYWSNWDLVNMCSYFAIGVLTENDEMINYIVNYFYSGAGNGCIKRLIRGTHTDPLGTGETICQNQESGRDQGHASMSLAVTAHLCQMAYTLYQSNPAIPELDFFAADNNAVLGMGEYIALSNLRDGSDNANTGGAWLIAADKIPFAEFKYCIDCSCKDKNHGATHIQVADDSGRGGIRPGWEILNYHYAKVKKLGSGYAYTKKYADKIRPEGGAGEPLNRYGLNSGAFDQIGWNTLMLYSE